MSQATEAKEKISQGLKDAKDYLKGKSEEAMVSKVTELQTRARIGYKNILSMLNLFHHSISG